MRTKRMTGIFTTLALALGMPVLTSAGLAQAAPAAKDEAAGSGSTVTSKDEAEKLKEHMKLRGQIAKVKYPAAKADIVSKVKGIKADDKKWFAETLPDKTYTSADEVFQALGWPTQAEAMPAKSK
jgi:hypothetical protein